MKVFVDTSALLALLDGDDAFHEQARSAFDKLLAAEATLSTSSYVVVETAALLQHRIGVAPVRALHERLLPIMDVVAVDQALHDTAYRALAVADRRRLSLVDWVSFEIMRRRAIPIAFTHDADFASQGFEVVP